MTNHTYHLSGIIKKRAAGFGMSETDTERLWVHGDRTNVCLYLTCVHIFAYWSESARGRAGKDVTFTQSVTLWERMTGQQVHSSERSLSFFRAQLACQFNICWANILTTQYVERGWGGKASWKQVAAGEDKAVSVNKIFGDVSAWWMAVLPEARQAGFDLSGFTNHTGGSPKAEFIHCSHDWWPVLTSTSWSGAEILMVLMEKWGCEFGVCCPERKSWSTHLYILICKDT